MAARRAALRCAACRSRPRAAAYGVLNVGKTDDDSFAADEVALLEQIGQQLAIAFENALSFRAAERYRQESIEQRDRLRLLLDVNNQLLAQHESHAMQLSALARAREFVSHDYAGAGDLATREANELRIEAHTYNDQRGVIESSRALPLGALAVGRGVLRAAHPDVHRGRVRPVRPGRAWRGLIEDGIRSVCCVPLITQRGPLGTLDRRPALAGRLHAVGGVRCSASVAGQVAIAVANTLAYQEISALKDRLTEEKLYSRTRSRRSATSTSSSAPARRSPACCARSAPWPRPTPRCSCSARPAPARSCSRAPSTTPAGGARRPSCG